MPDEVKDPAKNKPTLADASAKLKNNVEYFLTGFARLYPNLAESGPLSTGHKFDDTSRLYQDITILNNKAKSLLNHPDANVQAQAKAIIAEISGSDAKPGLLQMAEKEFSKMTSGAIQTVGDDKRLVSPAFDSTRWEKAFGSLELKLSEAATAIPEDKTFINTLDEIKSDTAAIKSSGIVTEITRLNDSVQRQQLTQYSDSMCQQLYGANWERKQFLRIDNPKAKPEDQMKQAPGADFTMESQEKVGLGESGSYRRPSSDYIVHMRDGVFTSTYSPVQQTFGTKMSRLGERFRKRNDETNPFEKVGQPYNFLSQFRDTVDAIVQLSPNINIIVFEYPDIKEFSIYHAKDLKIAVQEILDRQAAARLDGNVKLLGFRAGDKCMQGLLTSSEVPDKERNELLQMLRDADLGYQEVKKLRAGDPVENTADATAENTADNAAEPTSTVASTDNDTPPPPAPLPDPANVETAPNREAVEGGVAENQAAGQEPEIEFDDIGAERKANADHESAASQSDDLASDLHAEADAEVSVSSNADDNDNDENLDASIDLDEIDGGLEVENSRYAGNETPNQDARRSSITRVDDDNDSEVDLHAGDAPLMPRLSDAEEPAAENKHRSSVTRIEREEEASEEKIDLHAGDVPLMPRLAEQETPAVKVDREREVEVTRAARAHITRAPAEAKATAVTPPIATTTAPTQPQGEMKEKGVLMREHNNVSIGQNLHLFRVLTEELRSFEKDKSGLADIDLESKFKEVDAAFASLSNNAQKFAADVEMHNPASGKPSTGTYEVMKPMSDALKENIAVTTKPLVDNYKEKLQEMQAELSNTNTGPQGPK